MLTEKKQKKENANSTYKKKNENESWNSEGNTI